MLKYNSKMIKISLDGRKVQTIRPIKFPKDFFVLEAYMFKKDDIGKNWYPLCRRFQSNDETGWEEIVRGMLPLHFIQNITFKYFVMVRLS